MFITKKEHLRALQEIERKIEYRGHAGCCCQGLNCNRPVSKFMCGDIVTWDPDSKDGHYALVGLNKELIPRYHVTKIRMCFNRMQYEYYVEEPRPGYNTWCAEESIMYV